MNNLLVECEYAVEIRTGDTQTLVIFKPTTDTKKRIEEWRDLHNLEPRKIEILDASGDHVSRNLQVFVKLGTTEYHNTLILITL